MRKIGIVIPWDSPFIWTAPAFNMMNWERPDDCKLYFFMGAGWCPANRHNDGVAKAQQWGADLIMFNGGDHLCPKDIIRRMVDDIDKGYDMVQAMIPSRGVCGYQGIPFAALSYKVVGPIPKDNAVLNAPRDSIKVLSYADEPQESHMCGTGNIMMKVEIFDGLEKPYFEEFIKRDGRYGRWCVQDTDFVQRCTIHSGAKLFCDTSIELIHLDVFGIDKTFAERFKDKTQRMDWSPAKDMRKYV